jgi:hypothetical protein
VHNVAVEPSRQGDRLGRALLRFAEEGLSRVFFRKAVAQ